MSCTRLRTGAGKGLKRRGIVDLLRVKWQCLSLFPVKISGLDSQMKELLRAGGVCVDDMGAIDASMHGHETVRMRE